MSPVPQSKLLVQHKWQGRHKSPVQHMLVQQQCQKWELQQCQTLAVLQ
jgi:hypothetical protein